ncbi:MAG TPA: 50S ribosomal protein L21 [Acidobacteriota bacterium]|nr:50S ribosomal protein L21 [Acidobacteriota bacterium]HMZ78223.1 50S ribosomal protein L21 [Acidobacteriota bacterium]HNB71060.1 50S ribosomal protein L21 [Acidobacteriota bacterium]HNC42805.1 50S ribosomal protein L21 [Acidobacteriota bacterium]HND18508.1 50S ribosomal protein L21 [Acidobacteriota bacterium]
MSYAVVLTGGKQFRVQAGEVVRFPSLAANVGESVEFDQVLVLSNGSEIKIGQPTVTGAAVKGVVVEQGRGPKVIVFKFKRRKQYKRKQGHRQGFTAVRIESIA